MPDTLVEGECSHHYANPGPLMYVVYFILLQCRYILYLVYVSFCKCDIIIQFAVHLYDCTLYEISLQLNCFHNGFFTGPRYWLTNHYMLLH